MEGKCFVSCTYSRSINQEYPRLCIHCGKPEPKTEDKIVEPKITMTLSQWREATDKAINAVNESMSAADLRAGKVPHAEDRMIVTALGINICAELEKEIFKS